MERNQIASWLGVFLLGLVTVQAEEPTAPTLRRPIAVLVNSSGSLVYTANRESGTLSVVDVDARVVREEHAIATRPSAMAWLQPDRTLLLTDEQRHELQLVQVDGTNVRVAERLSVSRYPVRVVVSPQSNTAYVSSLWSRRVSAISLQSPLRVAWTVDLEIAPREMIVLPERERLIVADSFSSEMVVIDTRAQKMLGTTSIPGHKIRGLAAADDGERLIVAHQMLNELGHSINSDIHWGLVISNDLRWQRMDTVLERKENIYEGAKMKSLGEPGRGAADPSAIAVSDAQTVIVALGGVDEVSIGRAGDASLQRYPVGDRPSAIAIDNSHERAFVANMFGDSLSVIDLKAPKVLHAISLGAMRPLTLREKGERLFFDGSLSHDSWMSCASCHADGHTNGMLSDNLGDGSFGAPKRILTLLGKADTEPLAWNGSVDSFATQVRKSIEVTMQCDRKPREEEVLALAAYVKSLPPPPSLSEAREARDPVRIARGKAIFESKKCDQCHRAPLYTTPKTYNVGLKDELGLSRYNPPSLIGVSQRRTFLHDGRAKSLVDVFTKHQHRMKQPLEPEQLSDLLQFLGSL